MSAKSIDLKTFMNQQYLCESLTMNEVEKLLEYTELVSYNKNDIIAQADSVGDALYFVVRGEAALLFDDHGREMVVGSMKEGELMGEMSFFDHQPRMLQMRATRDQTDLLRLSRPMYERLRIEYPYIAVNLLEHAIISLDHLVRRLSTEEINLSRYIYGPGKR
jgi:CRP/FNR family cyclic AMP-dependent transcriptional regulator